MLRTECVIWVCSAESQDGRTELSQDLSTILPLSECYALGCCCC